MNPDQQLSSRITSAKSGRDLVRALESYYSAAEANAATFTATASKPLACAAGCSYCCHIPVAVHAQEVLLLAEHIKRTFSSAELAQLIERLRSHVALITPMTSDQQHRTNIPCPLLRDSRCSVYSARPFACRVYHSLDVSSCKKTYDDPNDLVTCAPHDQQYGHAWMTMIGLANAVFAQQGYDQNGYELGSALLEALTNPAASRRFQQRKKAFPAAKLFHAA